MGCHLLAADGVEFRDCVGGQDQARRRNVLAEVGHRGRPGDDHARGRALEQSLAAEWAGLGIRVNAIAPGYVKTEMAPVDRPEFRRHWIEDTPQQRYALPAEIAPSVVFLASPASSFMTGSILVIDGGYTIY